MFKKNLLPLFLIVLFASACAPTIYKSNNLASSKKSVKTLAILPFTGSIDSKRLPRGTTIETLKESEEKTGYDIQNNIYTWLLRRQNKYTVTFQDIDKTNAILQKEGITYEKMIMKEKGELCKLLGVDAIISGKTIMSKPMSEGSAIVVGVLTGGFGATNKTDITLTIHDTNSTLLWKYDHHVSGSLGSSPEKLTNSLMKKSSRKFPYRK